MSKKSAPYALGVLIAAVIVLSPLTRCQALPDAPVKQPAPKLDKFLALGAATVQTEDALSTRWVINHGGHEIELPTAISNHTPAMLALGAAKSYGEHWLSVRHRRIGEVVRMIDIAGTGYGATRNWFEGSHPPVHKGFRPTK